MIAILVLITYFLGVALGLVACGATNYFGLKATNCYGEYFGPDKFAASLAVAFWPLAAPILLAMWVAITTGQGLINLGFKLRAKMQDSVSKQDSERW